MSDLKQPPGAADYDADQHHRGNPSSHHVPRSEPSLNEDDDDDDEKKGGKERRKIEIKFIQDKSRRHITFSKRKFGIMKKAYELSVLTGTQVLLLVVSETGLVYTFTTPKLQPLVTKPEGKSLIQACLNAPDEAEAETPTPKETTGNYVPRQPAGSSQQPPPPPMQRHGGVAPNGLPIDPAGMMNLPDGDPALDEMARLNRGGLPEQYLSGEYSQYLPTPTPQQQQRYN